MSLFGGRAALYAFGWDVLTPFFTMVYANNHGKRTLHVEALDGSGTVLLWANKQSRGLQKELF